MKYSNKNNYQNQACYESFICKYCGNLIVPEGSGSHHRNHCPHCLSSLHVDNVPGDRAANESIGVWVRKNGE